MSNAGTPYREDEPGFHRPASALPATRPFFDLTGPDAPAPARGAHDDLYESGADPRGGARRLWRFVDECAQNAPILQSLLDDAQARGFTVGLYDIDAEHDFTIDWVTQTIRMHSKGHPPDRIVRHPVRMWDFVRAMTNALRAALMTQDHPWRANDLTIDHALLARRHQQADRDITAVLVFAQLREADVKTAWRSILGSDLGDLALSVLQRHPGTLPSSLAGYLYPLWFCQGPRVAAVDHITLSDLDPARGGPAHPLQGKRTLDPQWLHARSILPGHDAPYLLELCDDILSNPYYRDVHDPINEAHLMQMMDDQRLVEAGPVQFRDGALAARIFPGKTR